MSPEGRREAKQKRTRADLRDAAFRLFAERGFNETRVTDIAEACDVSDRTFFRYFGSKEHVAVAGLLEWCSQLFDAVEGVPDSCGPIEAIVEVMNQAEAGRFAFDEDLVRDVIAFSEFPEVQQYFAAAADASRVRLIAHYAKRAHTDEYDPYVRVLGSIISAGLFAIMESWLHGGMGDDPWRSARLNMARLAEEFAKTGLDSDGPRGSSTPVASAQDTIG